MSNPYVEAFESSVKTPDIFWAKAAEDLHWYKKWDKVLDDSKKPFYRWFTGGIVNTCYNALDYHVENGRADQVALIYDSPVTDTIKKYTYAELRDEVAIFAGALAARGVVKRRQGADLHAYDCGSSHRHAGLRTSRRGSFRCFRRVCGQ
jgi:propionyl-CoA synthetase